MRLWGLLVSVGLLGCANNVPQDRSTGPDGRVKGATPLAFENGEAKAKGIVTYPGGDRIDWKLIELPEKARGKLDLQLTWEAPRPGLQVAFDVFDQYNTPLAATAAVGKKARTGRTRTATIHDAVGTYFVRIYAPRRGDAGAYTLTASFIAEAQPDPDAILKLPIPDPPKLAAIPDPPLTCDLFDPSNSGCANKCPDDAPDTWKGCKIRIAERLRAEAAEAAKLARAECLKDQPKPFDARIIHLEVSGNTVTVKLDTGTDEQPPLTTGWNARVLKNGTNDPMASGTVRLQSVGKQQTKGAVGLTVDQLNENPWVRLTPPPANCP